MSYNDFSPKNNITKMDKKNLKFDVMVDGKFIKTLKMEYKGAFVTEDEVRAYALEKLPLSLKGEEFEIYYLEPKA